MLNFQFLKKLQKNISNELPEINMALMGDCATQLLATAIRGYGVEAGYKIDLFDADYNQIKMLAMNPHSELYEHEPEYIVIQMCVEKLFERFCQTPLSQRETLAETVLAEIEAVWDQIGQYSKSKIFQFDFVALYDNIFGSYGMKVEGSFTYQLNKLNFLMMQASLNH